MDRSGRLLKSTITLCITVSLCAFGRQAAGQNGAYPAGQNWDNFGGGAQTSPGNNDQYRYGMPPSGSPIQPVQYTQAPAGAAPHYPNTGTYAQPQTGYADAYGAPPIPVPAPGDFMQGGTMQGGTMQGGTVQGGAVQGGVVQGPAQGGYPHAAPGYGIPNNGRPLGGARIYDPPLGPDAIITPNPYSDPSRTADLNIRAEEAQTGRFQFGVGINSDAGVTGSIVIDERNFDWKRYPTSFDDVWNGRAWRGAGQGFRIEAMPGSQVQRYMVSFSEPYLMDTRVSLNLSGYLFDRIYRDWDEQRIGGRVGLGYRLTPDLSSSVSLRMENVEISDPRVNGVPALDSVIGDHALYTGSWNIAHDTRDLAFAPTEGHLFEISLEQAFGDFDYSRVEVDFRQYFLLAERPDGSGRHTLGFSGRAGFSSQDTPIFENFFAGGFSTLRGFDFRRVGPVVGDVYTGGPFRVLGSVEYLFPITADDMVKGVVFTDVGAVEESTKLVWDDFAVSPGVGLRISIPALGQAPIALDFAFPVNHADSDQTEMFSFFIGAAR